MSTSLPEPRVVTCPAAVGEVHDYGAHVTRWTPATFDPVLFVSASSHFVAGDPIRGGVPICFPWFGLGRRGPRTPLHGFARVTTWMLVDQHEDAEGAHVTYRLTESDLTPEHAANFPYRFEARLEVTFGARLHLVLQVTNTGAERFSYEEALHTYLAVGDVRRVRIFGLEGATYVDKTRDGALAVDDAALTITAETDRVYRSPGPVTVVDPAAERVLTIDTKGAANVVVWNPWIDKAAAMGDFGDEEWQQMLCIEAANALNDEVLLEPGQTHTLGYRVTVEHGLP